MGKIKKIFLKLTGIIVISVMSSAVSIAIYHHSYAQHIMTIDLHGFQEKITTALTEGKMTENEMDTQLNLLEEAIATQPKNVVLVLSDVVVSRNLEKVVP